MEPSDRLIDLGNTADPSSSDNRDDTAVVVALLRRVAAVLDRLWSQSLDGATGLTIRLGEASLGVHRALIALVEDPEEPPAGRSARRDRAAA